MDRVATSDTSTGSSTSPKPRRRRRPLRTLSIVAFSVLAGLTALGGILEALDDPDDPDLREVSTSQTTTAGRHGGSTTTAPTTTPPTTTAAPPTTAPTTTAAPPTTAPTTTAAPAAPTGVFAAGMVTHVVDGDTLDLDGNRIRLLGIDTPERGECGFDAATDRVRGLTSGRSVAVVSEGETDRYDRLLGYVEAGGTDVGEVLLHEGLARARYDSLDGYGRHPRQDLYRSIDRTTAHVCGSSPESERSAAASAVPGAGEDSVGGSSGGGGGIHFPNCDAARAAGAAPLVVGTPGYRLGLDRDRNGVACQ